MLKKETFLKRGLTAAAAAAIATVFIVNISSKHDGQTVIIAEGTSSCTAAVPDETTAQEIRVNRIEAANEVSALPEDNSDQTKSGETQNAPEPSDDAPDNTGLININTAGLEELKTLSGIGDVKAQAVIDYRIAHGPFSSAEQITDVKGIGEKTLEKIRAYITV